jgi:hypothetical protein
MSRDKLETDRKRLVIAAEARFGMREGVKRLRDGEDVRLVRISVQFYPKEHWIIEDIVGTPFDIVKDSGRALTDEIKSRLEEFL